MTEEYLKDPFCPLAKSKVRVSAKDPDPEWAKLSQYAHRVHNFRTYKLENGKIGFGGPKINRDLGIRGGLMVFGQEGEDLATTMAKAQLFLKDMTEGDIAKTQKSAEILGHAAHGGIPKLEPTMHWRDLGEDGALIGSYLEGLPDLDDVSSYLIGQRTVHSLRYKLVGGNRWLASVHASLSNMGPAGMVMAKLFERRNNLADALLARSNAKLQKNLTLLRDADRKSTNRRRGELVLEGYQQYVEFNKLRYATKDEKGNILMVDNTPFQGVMEQVYQDIKKLDDQFYSEAKVIGLKVKPKIQPGHMPGHTGRYFPHRFDMSKVQDKRITEGMITDAIEMFGLRNRDEAIGLLEKQASKGRTPGDRTMDIAALARQMMTNKPLIHTNYKHTVEIVEKYLNKNSERLAGNLEMDRLGVTGYLADMQKAYMATWTRNAYRIADTTVLGHNDKHIHRLLAQLDAESGGGQFGSRNVDFATKVYHLEIGQKDSGLHRNPLLRELYLWQGAKLSLGFLANSTQPLNTLMRVGLRPMIKAGLHLAARVRRDGKRAISKVAEESGALPITFADDPHGVLRLIGEVGAHVRQNGMEGLVNPAEITKGTLGGIQKLGRGMVGISMGAFRGIESWNRSLSVLAGEAYFDQLVNTLAKQGRKGLEHRKVKFRFNELDLDPEAVLKAVQNGDTSVIAAMRSRSGLRISDSTQFKSGIQSMPLWRNEHPMGQFAYQYKTFGLGQMEFMLKELSPGMFKSDPQRSLRAWGTLLTAFPGIGIAVSAGRASMMGETLSSELIEENLEDPTITNIITAGLVGMVGIGSLGIYADLIMTSLLGNELALKNFIVPPAGSSLINGLQIGSSAFWAMTSGDSSELLHGTRSLSREFGGGGSFIQKAVVEPYMFPGAGKAKSTRVPLGTI